MCSPKRLLIPLLAFLLPALLPAQTIRFTDVTKEMKVPGWVVNGVSCFGHGSFWTDISGDSLPDLYIANAVRKANSKISETLYISHAGAAYTEEDGSRGVSDGHGLTGTHGVVFADYDNDGDMDIFNATTDDKVRIYRNKGNGTFSDVTAAAALAGTRVTYPTYGELGYGTRALVAFDADNDGDMDLYATNWGPVENALEVPWETPAQPNEFWINKGDGTFVRDDNRGCTPINPSNEGTQGVTAVDIDEDGDLDIFVSHRNYAYLGKDAYGVDQFGMGAVPAPNDLFINDGTGYFTEVNVRERGLYSESNDCNGTTFADYDNDGDYDAFVLHTSNSPNRRIARVLQNDGKGYFKIVSSTANIEQWGFTSFIFDADNDGKLDIFAPATYDVSRFYRGDGTGKFQLQSNTGTEILAYDPRGGSIADMDNDGDLDIYYVDANKDTNANYSNRMFRNETVSANRWIKIWGSGPKGDLGAFGSKIWLFEPGGMDDMSRLLGYHQVVNGYGYLAQDDHVQHFGVGLRDSVDAKIMLLDGTVLKTRLKANTRFYFSKPVNLQILDGDKQSALSGEKLPLPLRVVVTDDKGKAVQGAVVTFSASSGSFAPATPVYTDNRGIASVAHTAGIAAGAQKVTAEMGGIKADFTVTVINDGPALLELASGSGQSAYSGQVLSDSIRVRVANSAGAGQAGHPVQFTVAVGGGLLKPGDATAVERLTNSSGIAAVAWQLGTVANSTQTLRISAAVGGTNLAGSPLDVQATALKRPVSAGRPRDIFLVSGDGQSGIAGETLARPFVVQLVDSLGVPCPDYDITFAVVEGEGTLAGAAQQLVRTNLDGQAIVVLTLGTRTGNANNRVRARYNSLAREIYFHSSALAATPSELRKKSGDLQTGDPGQTVPEPLLVQVVDRYGNGVPGHPVQFTATSGDGWINNQKSIVILCDSLGLAQAAFRLGTTPGAYMVSVAALYDEVALAGSPVSFTANALSEPAQLILAVADTLTGLMGQTLPEPLRLRVVDQSGYPVPNHLVTFWVRRGGGSLESKSELIRISDANGYAAALPTLGGAVGAYNNVFEAQSYGDAGLHLSGSPARFYVSALKSFASRMEMVNRAALSAQAGEMLEQPLAVRILDTADRPVAGQEVLFSVTKGTGKLGTGAVTAVSVASSAEGVAQITFRLGSELGSGAHQVQARADNGVQSLANSPVTFTIAAPFGQPDTTASTVIAQSPVTADGVTQSEVRMHLVDTKGNPVAGELLSVVVSGNGNRVTQPEQSTDVEGNANAYISSTVAENKTIRAYIASKGHFIQGGPVVSFLAGTPQRLNVLTGDYQTGVIQSALEKPVRVRLEDLNQNPVEGAALQFTPAVGSGEVAPRAEVISDAAGTAEITWILGPSAGQQELIVRASGTAVTRTLHATAALPDQLVLVKARGDGQFAAPGTVFHDSLTVRVVDSRQAPIYGAAVTFAIVQGSAQLGTTAAVLSDRYGLARVRLSAGVRTGAVKVRALLQTGENIDFNLSVAVSIPARLVKIYGDSLSDRVGSTVYPLTVRITDEAGNPVANAPVQWQALTAGAQLLDAQPMYTGNDGQVSATVRLGTLAGPCQFRAVNSQLGGSPVEFTLFATSAAAQELVIFEGDHQTARALKPLASPIKVRVADQYGNGVAGVVVQFEPLLGGGSVMPVQRYSDASGLAAATWTMGSGGTQRLQVKSPALPGRVVVFSAVLVENLVPVIHSVSDTAIVETQTLVFEVKVNDPDGGQVTLAAQNLPAGATFDAVNSRLFIWRPEFNQQGVYTVAFVASDENGGQSRKNMTIRVNNFNRPPVIQLFQPEDFYYIAPTARPVTFLVRAFDQDGDPLRCTWRLNGRIVGQKDTLTIFTGASLPSQFTLVAMVHDQSDSVSQAWSVQQAPTGVAVGEEEAMLPEADRLIQNYPNPFNPETTIAWELAKSQHVEIAIYNLAGQRIRALQSGKAPAGYHRLRWDGRDDRGAVVPSGVYLCLMQGESYRHSIKLLLLK